MSNAVVDQMLTEMDFFSSSAEEVFKFHATVLIEDFGVPAGYIVEMLHSLAAAVDGEHAIQNSISQT